MQLRVGLSFEVNTDQHGTTPRIGYVSLRDRVSAALRAIDLPESQRRRIRQLESMLGVINFVFDLCPQRDLKPESSHARPVEHWIKHFRHHTVRQREPDLRRERRRSAEPILRRSGPTLGQRRVASEQNRKNNPYHLWLINR